MKRIIVILVFSIVLATNVRESKAQLGLISGAMSLFKKASGALTPQDKALAQNLYDLVQNSRCLRLKLNFYMGFIKNNNACSANVDINRILRNYDSMVTTLGTSLMGTEQLIASLFSSTTSESGGASDLKQQIIDNLKRANESIKELETLNDYLNRSIQASLDAVDFINNNSVSGHEVSAKQTSIL